MIDAVLLTLHLMFQISNSSTLPDASSIVDRYVQLTHGTEHDKKPALTGVIAVDYSVTDSASGATYYVSTNRDRAGHVQTVVDDDAHPRQWGAGDGRAWSFSGQGVRVLTGKPADQILAASRGWSGGSLAAFATGWGGSLPSDDWREAFPTVKTVDRTVVRGEPCYEVVLKRKDGSSLRRWYQIRTGFLAREISTESDETGAEQTYETEVGDYETSLGVTYPSVLYVTSQSRKVKVSINSVARNTTSVRVAFELPREVAKAIAQLNTPQGLPNAVDVLEHFAKITGAAGNSDSIHSQIVKGELSFLEANLKVPIVVYAEGRKSYFSLDIPTMGKFEEGSDGEVAWERSVVLGPRIVPRSHMGGLFGPAFSEIASWTALDANMRTVGSAAVDGADCYVIEMPQGALDAVTKAYFDKKTGYLLRMETPQARNEAASLITLGDYRTEGGFTVAHHLATTLEGKQVMIDLSEIKFNVPIAEQVFRLPDDVVALVRHEQSEKKPGAGDGSNRPTLRRTPEN